MHIAICDDNVADRKQLERLLKRESDKRAAIHGVLYTDSFGHPANMLRNSMQYDTFFVDICDTEGINGVDVVNSLTKLGNTSPIVLCSSKLDYHNFPDLPERVLFLDKPIKVTELGMVLDQAQKIKDSSAPVIELREDKGTRYVHEEDILYAIEEGRHLIVTLKDGDKAVINTTALNFFSQVEHFPSFFSPNVRTVANARNIASIGLFKVTMIDGTSFKAFGQILAYAKEAYADTHSYS